MTATITRAEALYALAVAPFVTVCLVGIAVACTAVFMHERTQRRPLPRHKPNPYLSRVQGDLDRARRERDGRWGE